MIRMRNWGTLRLLLLKFSRFGTLRFPARSLCRRRGNLNASRTGCRNASIQNANEALLCGQNGPAHAGMIFLKCFRLRTYRLNSCKLYRGLCLDKSCGLPDRRRLLLGGRAFPNAIVSIWRRALLSGASEGNASEWSSFLMLIVIIIIIKLVLDIWKSRKYFQL